MKLQHDRTPPHIYKHVQFFSIENFWNRWISCGGPINYPARSKVDTPATTPEDMQNRIHFLKLLATNTMFILTEREFVSSFNNAELIIQFCWKKSS